jgi:acyl-CoA dehydrogenase
MSILYSEDQQAIAVETRRVVEATIDKAVLLGLLERRGAYDARFWAMAREQGWTALAIPGDHGGLGLGLVEMGIVAEACGAVATGVPFLTTGFGAARALATQPTLASEWLPKLAAGEAVGTIALAEAGATLPASPTVRYADGTLRGIKPGVVAGGAADIVIVLAEGPVLVAATLDDSVTRTLPNTFDNSRLIADLTFADTPATMIAEGEDALRIARDLLAAMAVVAAHEQVGGAGTLLAAARDYALERKAFGQVIGAFQSIKHRIAELFVAIEVARANALHAAAEDGKPEFLKAAAAARLSATEAYDLAARDAIQIHGGIGVTWEAALHLHQRRARTLAVEAGTPIFWEDLLVEELAA